MPQHRFGHKQHTGPLVTHVLLFFSVLQSSLLYFSSFSFPFSLFSADPWQRRRVVFVGCARLEADSKTKEAKELKEASGGERE